MSLRATLRWSFAAAGETPQRHVSPCSGVRAPTSGAAPGDLELGEQLKEPTGSGIDVSGELSDGRIETAQVRPARLFTFPALFVFGFRSHRRLQGSQPMFIVVTRYDRRTS